MPSIIHYCAVLAATMLLSASVNAQTISQLSMISNLDDPTGSISVDCVASVNFWDAKWQSLFVQEKQTAIFVKLPREYYRKEMDLQIGTQIRIKGRFDAGTHSIQAETIQKVGVGEPAQPVEISFNRIRMGDYWSRRVKFVAVVESVLVNDDSTELVMSHEGTRFFLRRLQGQSVAEVQEWIGSHIALTGTLACLVDHDGRPVTFICHCMPNDQFDVLPRNANESGVTSERLVSNVVGQVGFVSSSGRISVEKDDGTVTTVYCPFRQFLSPGDRVEIQAVAARRPLDEAQSPRLFLDDCQGLDCAVRTLIMQRTGHARLPAPVQITSKQIVANSMLNKRVRVSGEVLDVVEIDSRSGKKRIKMAGQGRVFIADIVADQQTLNKANLHPGSRLTVSGAVVQLAAGDTEFSLLVENLDDVHVHETWGHFPRATAIALVAGIICLVGGSLLVFWHLCSQVSNREQDLAQVIARLNSTYGAIREAILVIDDRGAVVGVNARVKDILGLSPEHLEAENQGRSTLANVKRRLGSCFANRQAFEQLWDEVLSDSGSVHSVELCTVEDPVRTLIVYTAPVDKLAGYSGARIWTFDDITDRKRLEANLLQSQKMEAIGCLAGGVAHDFNNLLMAMTANLELARLDPDSTIRESDEYLIAVEDSAHRAAKLIKHLLGFSRKASLDMKVVSPNEVIDGMRNLLQRTLDVGVHLKMNLLEDLGNVRADATQLEQVLLNICLNARDSFAGRGGMIEIETSNVSAANLPVCVPGKSIVAFEDYVCIQICDNGSGMPAEIQERIYDPFFTTKDPDKGTGLGLAMSFGIMEQHNGFIHCRSETGLGTQFQLLLPRVQEQAEPIVSIRSLPINAPEMGHVLLADDNAAVGHSTANALRAHGFSVTVVSDGKQAVDFVRHNPGLAIVAILDLAMPVMSGTEAFTRIAAMDRDLPVILYSGYLDEFSASFSDAAALPFAVLQKPFRMHELIELVSAAIGDHLEANSHISVG